MSRHAPHAATPTAAEADLVLIVHNRRAGAASASAQIDELRRLLERRRLEVVILQDAAEIAPRAVEASSRLRAVVAAGGDGTCQRLLNETPAGTPLAVMPLGTENLLAKYLGQAAGPEAVCRTLSAGQVIRLDAGRANGRLFSLMAGVGFDAATVQRLESTRGGHIRLASWIKPIWQTIRSYDYPAVRVYSSSTPGGWGEPSLARWVFVVNLPRYARGLQFAPQADGRDGKLDVCTFQGGGLITGLGYLGCLVCGWHHRLPGCRIEQTSRLRLESDDRVPFQLDGESAGELPLEVEVVPQRLSVWAPPEAGV